MNGYLASWLPAAEQLGVELSGPMTVALPDGESVIAQLHVPSFGAEKGMLVFKQVLSSRASNSLVESGYGYSVFAEPAADEITTMDDLVEVLRDWGWYGPEAEAPEWLQRKLRPPRTSTAP